MEILEERRKVKQIPVYEDGRIEYYKIPNYSLRTEFMTLSERNFFRTLINVIKRLNEEYKENKIFLQISTQVAINRIIDINNKRNSDLYQEIRDKSIDYVIYNLNNGNIICCIELDGKEHIENEKRLERDNLVDKMFKDVVKLIHIETKEQYDEEKIYKEIKE